MGMPTLKRFARPLDWAGMDAVLRRYARKVRKAHAEGQQARPLLEIRFRPKAGFLWSGGGGAGAGPWGVGAAPTAWR